MIHWGSGCLNGSPRVVRDLSTITARCLPRERDAVEINVGMEIDELGDW